MPIVRPSSATRWLVPVAAGGGDTRAPRWDRYRRRAAMLTHRAESRMLQKSEQKVPFDLEGLFHFVLAKGISKGISE